MCIFVTHVQRIDWSSRSRTNKCVNCYVLQHNFATFSRWVLSAQCTVYVFTTGNTQTTDRISISGFLWLKVCLSFNCLITPSPPKMSSGAQHAQKEHTIEEGRLKEKWTDVEGWGWGVHPKPTKYIQEVDLRNTSTIALQEIPTVASVCNYVLR